MLTEFNTEKLSTEDRFASWVELGARSLAPGSARSDFEHDFDASMRLLNLGDVQVTALTCPSLLTRRSPKQIRQSDPEAYQVALVLDGDIAFSQGDGDVRFGAGQFGLYNTSRSLVAQRSGPIGSRFILLQVPRLALPIPEGAIDRLTTVPFNARRGLGATFAGWLLDITARAGEFTPAEAPALASVTVQLLSAVLAAPLDAESALTPQARRRVLRLRINRFVEQRLADPDLTPATVADAHHISLRLLQQLFAEDGTTPAAWIRSRRLEGCRRDLADPGLAHRPIRGIAARWGFADPAHFSRTFRATYGTSPGDYRAAVRESAHLLRE